MQGKTPVRKQASKHSRVRSPGGHHSTVRPSYTPSALTRYKRGRPSQEDGLRRLPNCQPPQADERQAGVVRTSSENGCACTAAQSGTSQLPGALQNPPGCVGQPRQAEPYIQRRQGPDGRPRHPDGGQTLASQRAVSGPEPGYRRLH